MQAQLITPDDPVWSDVLSSVRHDTYHLPGYVTATAQHWGGEPLGIYVQEGDRLVLVPLIRRPLPGGLAGFDVVSPYGYSSPIASSAALTDERFIEESGEAIVGALRNANCASAFIRGHPILADPESLFRRNGDRQALGETVWIDLTLSYEERWKQMNRQARRSITLMGQEGYVADADGTWSMLDEFLELYKLTMDRAGAAQSYYFDIDYFRSLREGLADSVHLLYASKEGKIVSASIFLETSGIVQYHLGSSARLPGSLSGDRLVVDFAATWFAERGNSVLHLGGGRGAEQDSLLRFKSGFARNRASFAVWRVVVDPDLFSAACDAAGVSASLPSEMGRFFPPYRRDDTQ